jgi:hypothetical protein
MDFTNLPYMVGSTTFNLPAPANPAQHIIFLTAVMNFLLGVGVLQILILTLRLGIRSTTRRLAQTVGGVVFWLGAAAAAYVFLLAGTLDGWFQFWAALIILFGASLIVRFTIHFAARNSQRSTQCC